jgi:hypothetical protein
MLAHKKRQVETQLLHLMDLQSILLIQAGHLTRLLPKQLVE